MKHYDVNTQPIAGVRGQRREVKPDSPKREGYERMTEDEFQEWLAAQPPIEPSAEAPPEPTLEDRLAALEGKQRVLETKVETLETKEGTRR